MLPGGGQGSILVVHEQSRGTKPGGGLPEKQPMTYGKSNVTWYLLDEKFALRTDVR